MQCWSHPKPPPTHGETDVTGGSVAGVCRFRANFASTLCHFLPLPSARCSQERAGPESCNFRRRLIYHHMETLPHE
jgi:hypothetical protein